MKARKMDPKSLTYARAERNVALSFCPPISPCELCGYPKVKGYRCGRCDDNPKGLEGTTKALTGKGE